MKDGIYYSITVVKDGEAINFPPQPITELVPALLEAMFTSGICGAEEVTKRLNAMEDLKE